MAAFKRVQRHTTVSTVLNITSYATDLLQKFNNMMEGIVYDAYIYKNVFVGTSGVYKSMQRQENELPEGS